MAGDIYVSFGADTGDLEAAFALAKAETNALAREMRDLAAEMTKTGAGMDSELGAQLNVVGAKMAEAKAEMTGLRHEMSEARGAEAGGMLAGFKEKVEGLLAPMNAVMSLLPEIAEALAAAFAIEKVKEFAEGMAAVGLETARAAAILGEPTENIAALRLVAEASGVSLDQLEMSFARLSRNIADQAPAAKRALDALGLSFADLGGKNAQAMLETVAEAMSKVADGSTKAAIAQELFGRAGMEMIPLLDRGRAAIDDWAQAAAAAGVALKENVVARMEEMHAALTTMSAAFQGAGVAVFMEFSGVIEGAVKYVSDLTEEFTRAASGSGMLRGALDLVRVGLQLVETGLVGLTASIRMWWEIGWTATLEIANAFQGLGLQIADVFRGLAGGVEAFFSGLMTAAGAATHVVGQEFADLGAVVSGAFTGHAGDAWAKMKADAADASGAIKSAFAGATAGFDFSSASRDAAATASAAAKILADGVDEQKRILSDGQSELAAIWSSGTTEIKAEADKRNAVLAKASAAGDAAKAARDQVEATLAGLNEELKATEDVEAQKAKALDDGLAHHRLSVGEWLSQSQAALQQELASVKAIYAEELAAAADNVKEVARIKAAEADEIRKINDQMVADQRKANDQIAQQYQSTADTILGAWNSQLRGLLAGTESWHAAMLKIAQDLTLKMIEWAEQAVVHWVAGELAKTAASQAGAAARTAAGAGEASAGVAQDAMAAIKSIFTSAAEAFAGVFGFLAPVMGPAAAGPAAAAQATVLGAAGAVASADIGMWQVPGDQLALVHHNELVMPAAEAGAFRDLLSGAANGGRGGGGVSVSAPAHFHLSTPDAGTMKDVLMGNRGAIMKAIGQAVRDGAHHGVRGLKFT